MSQLENKTIAIIATDGVEQIELTAPRKALEGAGAKTILISIKNKEIKAWDTSNWGDTFPVDKIISESTSDDYDGLLIPGGVMNPDKLRMNKDVVSFVRSFFAQKKTIASICHGPWLLVEADIVEGVKVTSYPSLKTDLLNAGAVWVDQTVVVDNGIVTSRNPKDIPIFNEKMIEQFSDSSRV